MKPITVKQFKAILAKAPDNAVIVVPSDDHSYRLATLEITTALTDGHDMTEDFGEDITPESEYGNRIPVLLIA